MRLIAVRHGETEWNVAGREQGHLRRRNAAYNSFEYTAGRWSLETWNDTAHLDEIGSLEDPTVQKLAE